MSRPDIPGLVRFAWLKPVAETMNSKSTFSLEGKVDVSNRLIQLRASRLFLCLPVVEFWSEYLNGLSVLLV